MLRQSVIDKCQHLAEAANFKNKVLKLKNESYLAQLANSIPDPFKGEGLFEASQISTGPVGSEMSHTACEEDLVKKIANILANIIDIAKNEVNPICRTVIENVDKYVKERETINAHLGYTINYINYPTLFDDDIFEGLIENFKDNTDTLKPFNKIYLEKADELFSLEEFIELMKTGSESCDSKIIDYLSSFVKTVWPINFSQVFSLRNDIRYAISLFLCINGILNEKIDKANVLTQDEHVKLALMNIRSVLGRKINDIITLFNMSLKDGDLIVFGDWIPIEYDFTNPKNINVFYDNYKKWVSDKNGSIDSLLGYKFCIANGLINNKSLVDDPYYYKGIYDQRMAYNENLADISRPKWIKDGIALSISQYIGSSEKYSDEQKTKFQINLSNALLEEYYADSPIDIYIYQTVCKALDIEYDIQHLLIERATLIKNHHLGEDVDNDHILFMTTIRIIGYWLSEQFE